MGRLTPVPYERRPECDCCQKKMWQNSLGGWSCPEHGIRNGVDADQMLAIMAACFALVFLVSAFALLATAVHQ